MGKRQGPKKAFKAYPQSPDIPEKVLPPPPQRPPLPDFPLFCEPGPVRAMMGVPHKIVGRDAFGDTCMVADIRGWGYLTGKGLALALDGDTAADAQDKTAAFIIEAVNEKLVRDGHIPTPKEQAHNEQ